eukprot:TRINITY_DN18914_c1_g1_i2.p1 TRINITY_DN18914_c1_g1~~TRINITY_DN18914_c1_g1_i2.p1  ORF type:complete len:352 (+),score=56.21 TRINITY_DN18914_c1_g1_i2:56-1057(+)
MQCVGVFQRGGRLSPIQQHESSGFIKMTSYKRCKQVVLRAGLTVGAEQEIKKWDDVANEQEFFNKLQSEVQLGKIPEQLVPLWADFYSNYKKAVLGSGASGADEKLVAQIQSSIADRVIDQFVEPYIFPSFHQRLLTPYDYYQFGQNYVGTLVDFQNSVLGNQQQWDIIMQQIEQGDNVVLFTNHQTEADPGVFAHMLAASHPRLATDVCYVAGDRVVEDPLCKPFSMGRNLYCVHSKRHLDDVPELKDEKIQTNRRTLRLISENLQKGGNLLWIAPAGGRDRPDENDHYSPAVFDPTAVELMRRLSEAAAPQQHLYSMAMWCWPVMPPPKKS